MQFKLQFSEEAKLKLNGDVFETYAQNNTPGAYRVFWTYGPDKGNLYIINITPHP
jgi:hypothetical protein